MKLNQKLLYLSLHNLLRKKYGANQEISRKQIYEQLGRHYLIPKNLRCAVLKELEDMKLIKKKDRDNIILLDCDLSIEADASKFLEGLKMF
jgi:hypothetical protein